MIIKECYAKMNADFDGVMTRLIKADRVAKYTLKFPDDPSMELLLQKLAENDIETAFRAVHTLKGTASSLGFTEMYQCASDVTEELRGGKPGSLLGAKVEKLKAVYAIACDVISEYAANRED